MRAPSLHALRFIGTFTLALTTASPLAAQAKPAQNSDPISAEGYISPPEALAKLVTAPREANVTYASPSPGSRKFFMRTVSDGLPSLNLLGKAHHNLGGFQVDQAANRERGLTTRSAAGLEITEWETGRKVNVVVPAGARVGGASWSPDGSQVAFLALFDNATHLYLADPNTGKSRPLTSRSLLATAVTNYEWSGDNKSIVAVLVPDGRGAEPKEPAVAPSPMVRVNENNKLKTRTYASLLETPYDKDLLEYHMTGQLAVIDLKSRAVRKVGAPGMIRALSAAPDNQFFRVTYVEKPFSYLLPTSSFGSTEVIIDGTGKVIRELSKRPMREGEAVDDPDNQPRPQTPQARTAAADTGKRNLTWHPFQPGMIYAQIAPAPPAPARGGNNAAAPGGNAGRGGNNAQRQQLDSASLARRGDRLVHWVAPFDSTSAKVLYETDNRISAVRFSENGRIMFISETGAAGPVELAIMLDENNQKFTVVQPRRGAGAPVGGRGAGGAPGGGFGGRGGGAPSAFVTRMGSRGVPIVIVSTDGKSVFAQGSTPDSTAGRMPRAYVERIDIRTGERKRIYESTGDLFETISAPLDDDYTRILVQRESPTVVPQSFVVDVASKQAKQLTNNKDLMPEITSALRRTYTAKRADGYSFRVRVTLPADYKEGTRLPGMFWFYPREYDNQEAYDRSLNAGAGGPGGSQRFQNNGPRSMSFLTTQGYAVIEPDAPIFASEGQLPNDNYVVDLRNNLSAVIDALDTLAIIDRHRLGIGGHSYGAFSTVNAMVHTPFFKAGIAGDGAYNRTLTPNGFQSERRDLWQGRQTYLDMSPFLYADQLNGALLMYHSTEDQNVGTDPINSIKLYHALQGLGKTTSLYMYPYEDHGPIAKETVLDQWARWVAWLDKYVKNANKTTKITS
jgi:dipeptidyl aminopeptidase/acylaminoacyl peptidase